MHTSVDGVFTGALEHSMDLEVLPLRFHVDQDTAAMLIRFGMACMEHMNHEKEEQQQQQQQGKGTDTEQARGSGGSGVTMQARRQQQSVDVLYFRTFSLGQVRAKIDYVSKRTNLNGLREGNYIELLNVVPLENMKLIFPRYVERTTLFVKRQLCPPLLFFCENLKMFGSDVLGKDDDKIIFDTKFWPFFLTTDIF
jgi:hypothetical protein